MLSDLARVEADAGRARAHSRMGGGAQGGIMRAFIFDEAGTGKTKRSMDLLDDAEHILVICPASVVKTAWLPQISQWSHGKALTIEDYRKHGWPEDCRYLVVSYNMAEKLIS